MIVQSHVWQYPRAIKVWYAVQKVSCSVSSCYVELSDRRTSVGASRRAVSLMQTRLLFSCSSKATMCWISLLDISIPPLSKSRLVCQLVLMAGFHSNGTISSCSGAFVLTVIRGKAPNDAPIHFWPNKQHFLSATLNSKQLGLLRRRGIMLCNNEVCLLFRWHGEL